MERLWAPWRQAYVIGASGSGNDDCIFCQASSARVRLGPDSPRDELILVRGLVSFVILNLYPYNNGHLMVIPRSHTADFARLDPEVLNDLHGLLKLSVEVLQEVYRPEGMNIGMNLGKCAGAGIADHLHYHVVPRWNGDTNFMPVLGLTKVMVEHLDESYSKLRARFDQRLA